MNAFDEFAVEEALRMKEKMNAGKVTVVSLGPDRAIESIRTALAMGADDAVHINDGAYYDKADPYATAQVWQQPSRGLPMTQCSLANRPLMTTAARSRQCSASCSDCRW